MLKISYGSVVRVIACLVGVGCTQSQDRNDTLHDTIHAEAPTLPPSKPDSSPPTALDCKPGTVALGNDCVPDGNVVCAQGTVYEPETGRCVVDPTACGSGLAWAHGTCVHDDDLLAADLEEAKEPNDDLGAGRFALPPVGEATVLHGCISPREGASDADVWEIVVTAPALVDIVADGVGGLLAAFQVDDPSSDTPFSRYALSFTSDSVRREVFLPRAGVYRLSMFDIRALFSGGVSGGPNTCYFTTLTTLPLPPAEPLPLAPTAVTLDGHVRRFSHSSSGDGKVLAIEVTPKFSTLIPDFNIQSDSGLETSAEWTDYAGRARKVLGLLATERVDLFLEPDLMLGGGDCTISSRELSVPVLPRDGASITLGPSPSPRWDVLTGGLAYFDVGAEAALRFDMTLSQPASVSISRRVLDRGARSIIAPLGDPTTHVADTEVQFAEAGRYYVVVREPGESPVDVQSTVHQP